MSNQFEQTADNVLRKASEFGALGKYYDELIAAHQKDVEAAQSVAYMEGVGKLDETVRAAVVAALEQLINLPGANHDDIYYAGVKRLAEIEKELAE